MENIIRQAIITLDEGSKVKINLTMPTHTDLRFISDLERKIVKGWNESQPKQVHKVVKCHILRK